MAMRPSRGPQHLALGLLVACLCALGGCALPAIIADRVSSRGPKALYKPPPEPLLVVVERHEDSGMEQDRADRLAALIEERLTRHRAAVVVDGGKLLTFRSSTRPRNYEAMPAVAKGRAVGAAQVLEVLMRRCDAAPILGGESTATIVGSVRIIDCASGSSRWPGEHEDRRATFSGRTAGADAALESFAESVCGMFHDGP
jgi:hypothetical protein